MLSSDTFNDNTAQAGNGGAGGQGYNGPAGELGHPLGLADGPAPTASTAVTEGLAEAPRAEGPGSTV